MPTKHSIAIAVVYLGAPPNYFHLWLRSCESNPGITWFLFAEKAQMGDMSLPDNVHYIEFSREAFEALVRQKLGVFPSRWRNYKICDFRPALGHFLEEYFEGFDFWGYCDVDVLFGNISHFLTSDVLANHDRIFAGGHLSLIRNSPRLRLLYQEGSGEFEFRHVFSTGKYLGFDEWKGFYKICVKAGVRQYFDDFIADIDCDSFRLKLTGNIENQPNQVFVWERGRVLRLYRSAGKTHEDEFIYIHLQKRRFCEPGRELGETFLINPGSFFSYRDRSAVFDHGCFRELFPFWYAYCKRRMGNLVRKIVNSFRG